MKVSKRLRKALLLGASRVVFHGTAEKQEGSSAQKVCADLMRFQSKDVHLEIQIRSSYHLKGIILDSIGEKDVYSHLSFNDTKLDMEDIQQLSRKLGYTANLSHLEIRANSLVDNVGVDILSTGLKTLRNLNKLILVSCNIRDLGAASIATTIDQGLFQLDTLDMGCNSIESHGASRVLSSLRRCKSLRHLNLRSNLIGDRGAIFFASLLCETFQQPSAGSTPSILIAKCTCFTRQIQYQHDAAPRRCRLESRVAMGEVKQRQPFSQPNQCKCVQRVGRGSSSSPFAFVPRSRMQPHRR